MLALDASEYWWPGYKTMSSSTFESRFEALDHQAVIAAR